MADRYCKNCRHELGLEDTSFCPDCGPPVGRPVRIPSPEQVAEIMDDFFETTHYDRVSGEPFAEMPEDPDPYLEDDDEVEPEPPGQSPP